MLDMADKSFMWNSFMTEGLINFRNRLRDDEREALDKCHFLTTVIRGFAMTRSVRVGNNEAFLTIISRQSWKRAGTRYNARGVDDEGNVANFVETETILRMGDLLFGYTQIRGSVPIFWEQDANLLSAKINITRSAEATQPSFNRHFESLVQKFGTVHVVNLLADKPGEADLSQRYRLHIKDKAKQLGNSLQFTEFDFHAEVAYGGYSSASRIIRRMQDAFLEIGFYSHNVKDPQDRTEQLGIFRTNCLDCLDRTNMIQQLISREALSMFFEYHDIHPGAEIWGKHNIIWADNGDQLSQIYAGTNALKTSFTRSGKMGLAGAISDVTKSLGRMYINNFADGKKQTTIELLLGRADGQQQVALHDPINDFVTKELHRRRGEFSSSREVKIFAGTFNLNGVMSNADLSGWLFPPSGGEFTPDVVLVGFQEIVELTPSQILNAESGKREFWERQVAQCLNERDSYVLVRSDQLVGTALMMFVKKSEVNYVRNVEGAMKKTGLGGMAGNKGGIAVSFNFASTSFCFITAHLAAGLNNVDERHNDYKTILSGLIFSRGRRVKGHDSVIWLGDFNYRVGLPYDHVKEVVHAGDYESLLEDDQLTVQMRKGATFPYYNEMQIKFPPTYKFDNDSDEYDTSEKMRTPSWTDRILSRGPNLRQTSYGCESKIKFSDHRPVYATFEATIIIVDEDIRSKLSRELYDRRRAEVGDANDLVSLIDINETTLTHGLPPPSSDSRKWWLSGGQATKVGINPPGPSMVLNPARKSNPFDQDKDFVEKPPLPPRPATFTAMPLKPEPRLSSHKTFASSTPLPRRSSTPTSSNSSSTAVHSTASAKATAKTPPPVPRKPDSLSVTRKPVVKQHQQHAAVVTSSAKVDSKTMSVLRPAVPPQARGTPPPLPERKESVASLAGSGVVKPIVTMTPPPPPPSRGSVSSTAGSSKSLMDEDDGNDKARTWTPPPLPPSRGSSVSSNLSAMSSSKSLMDTDENVDVSGGSGNGNLAISGMAVLKPTTKN